MSRNSLKLNPTAGNVQFRKELLENITKERKLFLEKESKANIKGETVGPGRLINNDTSLNRQDVDNDEIRKKIDKGNYLLLDCQAFESNDL